MPTSTSNTTQSIHMNMKLASTTDQTTSYCKIVSINTKKDTNAEFGLNLHIKDQNGWHVMPFNEIVRIEAQNNYCIIHTSNQKKLLVSMTLKKLTLKLSPTEFIRCHQSHIISVSKIRKVDLNQTIVLSDDSRVPISRRKWTSIKSFILNI